ncbi:hypothetical protein LA080_014816 [Diaporthe eres]|nr:hypothetical protein LA080_014816 [Diaporthe eres]
MLARDFSRDIVDFPVATCGDQYPQSQHPQWLDQPRARNDFTWVTSSLPRSCPQAGEYPLPIHSREPESKRYLGSRPGSAGPGDKMPTFEELYDVPQVNLAPRETERKSILERFPMEIFMRIMVHCDWKKQILLRRCNSNMYDMVKLDAIPWEKKTAILLHEENYNPENFQKKTSRSQDDTGPGTQDSDAASSPDDEGPSLSKAIKGKRNQRKLSPKPKQRAKDKSRQDDIDKFACYSCFKILPAYYFEGKHLETKTNGTIKGQRKRGHNTQSDKKFDTRVEYVQVISVNPSRPPEWLVKDKAEVRATDVESYVTEYMKKGVNCDDLRLHYKDITSGTHCIAPVRGVNPFFTASWSATPPRCETYRPVYQVEAGNIPGAGVDSSAYTYEICIPENSLRDESPMGRPHIRPFTRICQPQQQTRSDASQAGPAAPAPQSKEIIALRRFCILCGAKYGAYTRECNRKIISKVTEEGWWVCACRKVRQAGVGRNCTDCAPQPNASKTSIRHQRRHRRVGFEGSGPRWLARAREGRGQLGTQQHKVGRGRSPGASSYGGNASRADRQLPADTRCMSWTLSPIGNTRICVIGLEATAVETVETIDAAERSKIFRYSFVIFVFFRTTVLASQELWL